MIGATRLYVLPKAAHRALFLGNFSILALLNTRIKGDASLQSLHL